MIDNRMYLAHKCRTLMVLFVASLFVSCDEQYMNPIQVESGAAFSLISDIDALPFGDSFTFSFAATQEWYIMGMPKWITASQNRGPAGTYTIRFSVNVNDSYLDREGHISFATLKGAKLGEFTVRQKRPYLTISSDDIYFSWDRCSNEEESFDTKPINLEISSNIDWKIDVGESGSSNSFEQYFSISSVEGKNDSIISIIPRDLNLGATPHYSTIRLIPMKAGSGGNLSPITLNNIPAIDISVEQGNLRFIINGSTSNSNVDITETNKNNVPFIIDSALPWVIDSISSDWICLNSLEGDPGKTTLSLVAASANTTKQDRTGKIVISNGKVKRTVTVRQYGYTFDVKYNSSFHFANDETVQRSIQLTTKGGWEIDSIPYWLNVNPSFGEGNAIITVSPKSQNYSTEDNNINLIIKSTLNSFADTIPVSQDAFLFKVGKQSHTFTSPIGSDNSVLTVPISCKGDAVITTDSEWISIDKTYVTEEGILTVSVSDNFTENERTGTITVNSLISSNTSTITITQVPYLFDNLDKSIDFSAPANEVVEQIICSGKWAVTCPDTWVALTPSTISGNGSLLIRVQENTQPIDRSSTITVSCKDNPSLFKHININQTQHLFDLDTTRLEFGPLEFDVDKKVKVNASFQWTAYANADWISVNNDPDHNEVLIRTLANTDTVRRSSTVVVKSNDSPLKKNVTIVQEPYIFDCESVDHDIAATDADDDQIKVKCSGKWSVSSSNNWISCVQSTNTGNGVITASFMDNHHDVGRNGSIVVKCEDNDNISIVVLFYQLPQ